MTKIICVTILLLSCQLLKSEVPLDQTSKFYILPNFSINSFQSYDNDVLEVYDYSPSFGIDVEYAKNSPWRIVGELNYYLVPDWLPMEISLGVKKMNNIKSLKSLQYYWNVNLDYKVLMYIGTNDKWGYNCAHCIQYTDLSHISYNKLNNGDWTSSIGVDLSYGLDYSFNGMYFIGFQIGYKLYSYYLKDNKFIELGYVIDADDGSYSYLKRLDESDDFVNPDGFFLKLGLGVNLWE